jgi:hypothetical protein
VVAICHAFLGTNAQSRRCQCQCSRPQARGRYSGSGSHWPSTYDILPNFHAASTPVFASALSDAIGQTSARTCPYVPDGHLHGPGTTNPAQPQLPLVPRMSISIGPTGPASFKGMDLMMTIPVPPTNDEPSWTSRGSTTTNTSTILSVFTSFSCPSR